MALVPAFVERPFSRLLDPAARVIARAPVTPNNVSTVGCCLNLSASLLLFFGWFVSAGVLILLAGLFDILDGKVARFTKRVSIYGAVYDSTVDRIGELAIYTGLGAYLVVHGFHLTALVAVLAIGGSVLISYVRARAEAYRIPCRVGLLRRAERVILFGMGAALNFVDGIFHEPTRWAASLFHFSYAYPPMPLTLVVLAIAILAPVTVVQRLMHIRMLEPE